MTTEQLQQMAAFIRPKELLPAERAAAVLGVKKSKFYEFQRDFPDFPKAYTIEGTALVRYWRHEIEDWAVKHYVVKGA